ncbi:MAG: GNAT family N-acetyltransferase [Armatimonadota bacterium]
MSPALDTVIAPLVDGAPDPQAGPPAAALPAEWADWAEEPGQRVSLEENGRTLGAVHVVMVGGDEAWLEGLWVLPSARGRGVGRRLVEEAEAVARGYGATIVRAAVPAGDDAALAFAQGMGFARLCEAAVGVADLSSGPIAVPDGVQVTPARAADVAAIIGAIGGSEYLAAWHGLVPLGWRFRAVRPELVRGLIGDGRVLRSGEPVNGVAAFALHGQAAVISFLAGRPAHRQALYGEVAGRARAAGARRAVLFSPDGGLPATFVPHPWCPNGLVIIERRLGAGTGH